jgi:hypothetical protein
LGYIHPDLWAILAQTFGLYSPKSLGYISPDFWARLTQTSGPGLPRLLGNAYPEVWVILAQTSGSGWRRFLSPEWGAAAVSPHFPSRPASSPRQVASLVVVNGGLSFPRRGISGPFPSRFTSFAPTAGGSVKTGSRVGRLPRAPLRTMLYYQHSIAGNRK